jgi:hypothetical protein
MSLFGIESEDDCRKEIDTLLEFHERANRAKNKETIAALKSQLSAYHRKGATQQGERQMSPIEAQYFWPAVREAYVRAPKLSSRPTWTEGLWEIEHSLRYHRPKE